MQHLNKHAETAISVPIAGPANQLIMDQFTVDSRSNADQEGRRSQGVHLQFDTGIQRFHQSVIHAHKTLHIKPCSASPSLLNFFYCMYVVRVLHGATEWVLHFMQHMSQMTKSLTLQYTFLHQCGPALLRHMGVYLSVGR